MKELIVIFFIACCLNHVVLSQSTTQKSFTLNFDFNSYSISQTDSTKLLDVLAHCNSPKFSFLKIFAFSDTVGTAAYNDELSRKRAMVVWNLLSEQTSLKEDKIHIEWLGESEEIYDLHFEKAHSQQRCVDVIVLLNE